MSREIIFRMMVGLQLFCCAGVLLASDADELRKRAEDLLRKASISAEQGNPEQAERLKRESAELLESAERLDSKTNEGEERGIERDVRHLKERMQDLLAKEQKLRESHASENELSEVREQIARTERELHWIRTHHAGQGNLPDAFHAQAMKLENATRRIHHLRVAAENLKIADAHDLAFQIMEKAEAMEREVQEGKKRLAAEMQKAQHGERGPDLARELTAEIERLRAEVKELRQKVAER